MKSIELFAGAGGLGMGMTLAGFDHLLVNEWNKDACDTIQRNKEMGHPLAKKWPLVSGDVRNIDFKQFEGKVDLISGGPPCQPFSLGGKHKGYLDPRDMFPEAIRAVRQAQPKAFLLENVRGLVRPAFFNYFQYILFCLEFPDLLPKPRETWMGHLRRLERHKSSRSEKGLQYQVFAEVLNAADYGVPQRRDRVIIVGFRKDLDICWSHPQATYSYDSLLYTKWISGEYWDRHQISKNQRPALPEKSKKRILALSDLDPKLMLPAYRTDRDALTGLPDPSKRRLAAAIPNHTFQDGARSYPGHTGSEIDEPAKTLKAGDHGVPGGENMLRREDGSVRYFTVRESARLQTFPEDYLFFSSWTENMRQLGNAVPLELARAIGTSIHLKLRELELRSRRGGDVREAVQST